MSARWAPVRLRAVAAREACLVAGNESLAGLALASAAITVCGVSLFGVRPDDPLLHGARAVFAGQYVAYDCTLSKTQAAFALAHELGHMVLNHGDGWQCAETHLDETATPERLEYAASAVDAYHPRQHRELEANVFAAAFLLPPEQARAQFLAGASYWHLAVQYEVTPALALNVLATTLLQPPVEHMPPPALAPLDDSQQAAAGVEHGPVLVNAGPGTGKTRTLAGRVVHLVERGVPARRILAVTYSNRAATELRDRLRAAAPDRAHEVTVSTFHGFCLDVLRRFHSDAGLPPEFAVVDQVDAVLMLERHVASLGITLDPVRPAAALAAMLRHVSRAKDELLTPQRLDTLLPQILPRDGPAPGAPGTSGVPGSPGLAAGNAGPVPASPDDWATVAKVYALYQRLLDARGLVDFGDLIVRTVALLRAHPGVARQLQEEYRHILVDEYQDMNRASSVLLRLLAGDGRGLWVVGDLRQAIYRFRGASPANVTGFPRDFPGGQVMSLGVNYRSDPHLVQLFAVAGAQMQLPGATPPVWAARNDAGPLPRVWSAVAVDGEAETAGLTAEIRQREAAGRPFRDQAVLVRSHYQATEIVAALERDGIPVLYLGDLFARPEVRDLLALLAFCAEGDVVALLRLAAMPGHTFPQEDVLRLVQYARRYDLAFPKR